MAKPSSQKFIGRNRAPRVQIEYDVELYGSPKKVQIPFVMGVMADLSGDVKEPLPPVDEVLDVVDHDRDRRSRVRVLAQRDRSLSGGAAQRAGRTSATTCA